MRTKRKFSLKKVKEKTTSEVSHLGSRISLGSVNGKNGILCRLSFLQFLFFFFLYSHTDRLTKYNKPFLGGLKIGTAVEGAKKLRNVD